MVLPHLDALEEGNALKLTFFDKSSRISFAEVLRFWEVSADFRDTFIRTLSECSFTAFRWETPALTLATLGQPFQCVLVNSPHLSCVPDPTAFAEHLAGSPSVEIAEFPNLGGDAFLLVPRAKEKALAYGHLAAFLRLGDATQKHALWQAIAAAMKRRLGTEPLWLSTAGAGVPWLHVRIDRRPKYYHHAPYRQADYLK